MDSSLAGSYISNFDYPILIVTKSRKITNLSTNVTQISIRMIPALSDCAHESHTIYVHRKLLLQLSKCTRKNFRAFYVLKKSKFRYFLQFFLFTTELTSAQNSPCSHCLRSFTQPQPNVEPTYLRCPGHFSTNLSQLHVILETFYEACAEKIRFETMSISTSLPLDHLNVYFLLRTNLTPYIPTKKADRQEGLP